MENAQDRQQDIRPEILATVNAVIDLLQERNSDFTADEGTRLEWAQLLQHIPLNGIKRAGMKLASKAPEAPTASDIAEEYRELLQAPSHTARGDISRLVRGSGPFAWVGWRRAQGGRYAFVVKGGPFDSEAQARAWAGAGGDVSRTLGLRYGNEMHVLIDRAIEKSGGLLALSCLEGNAQNEAIDSAVELFELELMKATGEVGASKPQEADMQVEFDMDVASPPRQTRRSRSFYAGQ